MRPRAGCTGPPHTALGCRSHGRHAAETPGPRALGTVATMAAEDAAPPTRSLVVRVWLPDRPGALGQVASRIGSLRGDVTAIDILERGGGRVVDELVVSLPETVNESLLAREVSTVDGVAVEHIRHVRGERDDPATALLDVAAAVAEAAPPERIPVLCRHLLDTLDADWAVVVAGGELVHWCGAEPPEPAWVLAFLSGSGHLDARAERAPGDIVWARLPTAGATIAAGRAARAFHERERGRTTTLARVLDRLLT